MKKQSILAAALVVTALLAGPAPRAAEDALEILRKTTNREYQDITLTVHLVKTSSSGRERPMDLIVKIKDGPEARKTLAEFTAPKEVAGMMSLVWDYPAPEKETERWFKLSGLEFVKCLGKACQKMEERFGFSMEIFAVDLERAEHKLLGEETVGGAACYKVESVVKNQDHPEGDRFITWVDKEKFAARKIEAYDLAGQRTQASEFTEFKEAGGRWWETKGRLENFDSGRKLSFSIDQIVVNAGIPDQVFEKPAKFSIKEDE